MVSEKPWGHSETFDDPPFQAAFFGNQTSELITAATYPYLA